MHEPKPTYVIFDRLRALRGSVRRRLLAYGVCAVLAGGVVALLTIIFLDWLLRFPALLRIVAVVFFFAGFLAATYRWIVVPWQAALSLSQIAAKLEEYFPQLGEQLSSAVNFAQQSEAGSASLVRGVLVHTDHLARDLPLERILSLRPLLIHAVLVALGGGTLMALAYVTPSWLGTGVHRYVHPFGRTEWPRTVQIVPLTGDQRVAMGDPVTLRMRVERGLTDGLRGLVHLRYSDGGEAVRTMQRDDQGGFEVTLDAVTSGFAYWFEAGDDRTLPDLGHVEVIARPEIVDATATIDPPSYCLRPTRRTEDLGAGPVRAHLGGRITVAIRSSKPVAVRLVESSAPGSVLVMDTGVRIPLEAGEDRRNLFASFEVSRDCHFRVELRDEDGFANRGVARYSIVAVPDKPPEVRFLEPTSETELTAQGSLELIIRAEDDFGLAGLRLITLRQADGQIYETSLNDGLLTQPTADRVEAVIRHTWNAAPLLLSPGDVIVQTAEARDNFPEGEPAGQVGRSAPLRIRIISGGEFEIRMRDDLKYVQDRLRELTLDQTGLLDKVEILLAGGEPLDVADRESAHSLALQQTKLVRRLSEIAQRLGNLSEQVQRNNFREKSAAQRFDSLREEARQIAEGPMTESSHDLNRAPQAPDAEAQSTALRNAAQGQETALRRLRDLANQMMQWGTFQQVTSRTRDLLDRQDALHGQTVKIGQSTFGKEQEALTADEVSTLKRAQRQQEQLAGDVEQHLAHLRDLRAASEGGNAETAPVEAALREAQSRELGRRVQSAAEALSANRTSSAALEQKSAMQALRAMVEALEHRGRRELENLQKELAAAEEQVAQLLQAQEALRTATEEMMGEGGKLPALAPEQRRIKNNTRLLAEELTEHRRVATAAQSVAEAVSPMSQAEQGLHEGKPEKAAEFQDQAIELLRAALVRIEELSALLAEEAFMQSLTEIQEALAEIRTEQLGIQERLTQLRNEVGSDSRFDRRESREATKLAQQQHENRNRVEAILPHLDRVVVYRWTLRRAAEWMETVREKLDARRVDEDLLALGERIIRELAKLTDALIQTQRFPRDSQFADSENAGENGGGQAQRGRPVPPLTELILLKELQVDLHERTRALSESITADHPSEKQLRELAVLGENQRELGQLTEQMTGRAGHTESAPHE